MIKFQQNLIVLCFLSFIFQVQSSAKVLEQVDVDQDQEQELILENRYSRFVFKPSLGKINSFVIKPSGIELLRDADGRKERGALLSDYIVQQGNFGDFANQPYSFEILENSDTKAVVRFSRRGQTDLLKWITITKTITVQANSPEINVDYEVANEQASMEHYYLGLGIHNEFDSGQELMFSMPLTTGVLYKKMTPLSSSGTDQHFYNIARGWLAVSFETHGGIAFCFDYSNLKEFYEWHKTTLRSFSVSFLTKKIEPGKSFKTSFTILPFSSFIQVDGVVEKYVGSIKIDAIPEKGEKVPVQVFLSGSDISPELKIFVISPGGKEQPLSSASAGRNKAGFWVFNAEFIPQQDGLYIIKAIVKDDNGKTGEFEKPVKIGETTVQYMLKPLISKSEDNSHTAKTIPRPASSDTKTSIVPIQQGLPEDIKLSTEIQTPHIPWANPYYLGKTKIFFITHTSKEREVIEMAERCSIEFYRVTHGNVGWKVPWKVRSYWTPSLAAQHQKEILQQQPLDTIIISAPWSSLDPEVQKLILKRVENGTGLVVISPREVKNVRYGYDYPLTFSDEELKKFPEGLLISAVNSYGKWKKMKEHFITTGIPFDVLKSPYSVHKLNSGAEVLAEVDGNPLVVTGEYGRGRVVCINYNDSDYQHRGMAFLPEIHPFNTGSGIVVSNPEYPTFQWWEYVWSMVIKASLWASGREPELLIEKIYPDGKNVLMALDNQRSTARFNFDITVRDEFSRVRTKKVVAKIVSKGKSKITLPIDDLSGSGMYFVDVIIKAGELVVNWGTTNVFLPQVNSIKSIRTEKEFYTTSEKVKTDIILEKPWSQNHNLTLHGFVYDSRNCLWENQVFPVQEGTQSTRCELPLIKVPTMAFYVCFQLRQGQNIVDEKRIRGIVAQKNEWDDYIYGLEVGAGSVNYYQTYWLEELRKNGVNLLKTSRMAGLGNLGYCVESGMKIADTSRILDTFLLHGKQQEYQQLKTNYFKTGDLKYLIRPVCFNDPEYRGEVKKRIELVVGLMKGYGALDYTLTDELSITHFSDAYDFCFCKNCIKSFREWVKPQYKNLDELNQSYGTNFASWDEVRPVTAKEAREKGKWSGWADHRRFNEEFLAEFVRWIRNEIRKIQPDATISLSGTQIPGSYNGHDVWLRTQIFDNLWSYGAGNQIIMHHSFNSSLKQLPWGGYGSSGASLKHKLWENVFEGGYGNCFWWFPINLDPDFTTNPCSASWNEAVKDLLKGIGKTIFTSVFEDNGVAIYYSQSSIHASYALDASSTLDADREAWVEVLKRNQISPSFISYGQVEQGRLIYPQVKVLILPYTISLSEKESDAMKKFVASGGTIIGDMQTGIMDQHCRPYKKGLLDEVFGFNRVNSDVSPIFENGTWNNMKNWSFTSDIPIQLQEPGISVTTGYALYKSGRTPGIIVNSYGKGKAWYFNFNLSQFESLRKKSQDRILLDFVKEVLYQSGIEPLIKVVDGKGNLQHECQVFVYKQDSAYFVGLLPDINFQDGSLSKKTRLIVPAGYRIFDIRNDKPVNLEEITLEPGIAHFYSLLPYSIEDVQVKIPSATKPGDTLNVSVSLTTKGKQPSNHVIRIEFYNPHGEEMYWYSRNILTTKGKAEYQISLPLNAESGKWKVFVKDLPSGTKKIEEFEVKGRVSDAGG